MPHFWKTVAISLVECSSYALSRLSLDEQLTLGRQLGHRRGAKTTENLLPFLKEFLNMHDGITNRLEVNGEFRIIEATSHLGFNTIFDVGANKGRWSLHCLEHHKDAYIHSFEIVPSTFDLLEKGLAGVDRVKLNSAGLSGSKDKINVYYCPTDNQISSTLDFGVHLETCVGQVIRGDDYCLEHNIETIDFLKIDVDGAESQVLFGFEPLLETQKIRLIQFEYNAGAIVSKFLLRDFYRYLTKYGYVLGKLYPDGVKFMDYDLSHEDFKGPNYVACLKSDRGILEAISL
jgi:FkbM family methyltransferase